MITIGILDFARRQTPESGHDHFEGDWDEMVELVTSQWEQRIVSPSNSEVMLVPMPEPIAHRFFTGTVTVTEATPLVAEFAPRVAGEEPFIQVHAAAGEKAPARRVEIICYSHEVLARDGDAPPTREADYYIVAIKAYPTTEAEPMNPMTMARNFLGLKGGTRPEVPYTAEDFARAILYWSCHTHVSETRR